MNTWKGVLLGLAVSVATGATTSSAAAASAMCSTARPAHASKSCGPDTLVASTVTTLLPLDTEPGKYQLWITSSKAGGLTGLVRWSPPANMTVSAITRIENGRCSLSGGRIACVAARPARGMTVSFTADVLEIDVRPRDARPVVQRLDLGRGQFRLRVTSRTARALEAFTYTPPEGMTIRAISLSFGGTCALVGARVTCRSFGEGIPMPHPLSVDFLADVVKPAFDDRYWVFNGNEYFGFWCGPMTPCPWHIPTFLPGERADLPLCKQGQTSTNAQPCIKP